MSEPEDSADTERSGSEEGEMSESEDSAEILEAAVQDIVTEQKYTNERFSLYRNGRYAFKKTMDDIISLKDRGRPEIYDKVMNRRVPRNSYRGIFTTEDRAELKALADQQQEFHGEKRRYRPMPDLEKRDIRVAFSGAARLLNNKFRFVRYLAAGGQGMVSLWEYRPGRGKLYRLVMKVAKETRFRIDSQGRLGLDKQALAGEKYFMAVSLYDYGWVTAARMLIQEL